MSIVIGYKYSDKIEKSILSLWLFTFLIGYLTLLCIFVIFQAKLLEQIQGFIFRCFHDFTFAWTFVVNADKVKYAVNDDAMQFVVISFVEQFGIGAHCIKADKQVAT